MEWLIATFWHLQGKQGFKNWTHVDKLKSFLTLHRVIQEERWIFCNKISVIVRKKVHKNIGLILSGYQVRALLIYTYKSTVNGNTETEINFSLMFKWQIGNTAITNLLQLTTNLQKSHQTQSTLQPVCKGHTLFIWADIHISSCGQQHPKCEPAIHLVYPPLFCKLHSSSNPTNKNLKSYAWGFKQLYLSNQSEVTLLDLYKLAWRWLQCGRNM